MTKLSFIFLFSLALCGCAQKVTKTTANTAEKKPFEKIIYHSTMCLGSCPVYHLEINQDKSFRLFAEKVFKDSETSRFEIDSSKIGYFKGTLSDSVYLQLSNEIKRINIDSLSFPDIQCCDGSVKTLIIYHHGKRKFLRSMLPPKEVKALLSLLRNISEGTKEKTSEIFEIENPK